MSCEQFLSSSWHVKKAAASNLLLLLFSFFFSGQGAIILCCLQRTPDQTITLSGSQLVQTAPKGFDSTDKWGPGATQPLRGERSMASWEKRCHCILTSLWDTAVQLFYQQSCGTVSEQGTPGGSQMCSFLSPILSVWHCDYGHLDSLWWSL